MNDDLCVVVIRLKTGEDMLAIFLDEDDVMLKVRYPYFAKYDLSERHIVMIPYCPLSDESFFEIKREKIEFVVVARSDVVTRYLHNVTQFASESEEETETTPIDESPHSTFIDGNDTKH